MWAVVLALALSAFVLAVIVVALFIAYTDAVTELTSSDHAGPAAPHPTHGRRTRWQATLWVLRRSLHRRNSA
jgi:hypothetical protein